MGKKHSRTPPAGAEPLFSLVACELRNGLVRLEVASGSYGQAGWFTLAEVHRLRLLLDVVLAQARAGSIAVLTERNDARP